MISILIFLIGFLWIVFCHHYSDFYSEKKIYQYWKKKQLNCFYIGKSVFKKLFFTPISQKKTLLASIFSLAILGIYNLFIFNNTSLMIFIPILVLILISFIDVKSKIIPNEFVIFLLISGICYKYYFLNLESLYKDLIAITIILILLFFLNKIYRIFKGYEGLGFGDIKLICSIVPWFGTSKVIYMIIMSSWLTVLYYIYLVIDNRKENEIPFAPMITVSAIILNAFTVIN